MCFSPDGATAFVSLSGRAQFTEEPVDGMACAITGPWGDGPS